MTFRLRPVAAAAIAFRLLPAAAQEAPDAANATRMKEVKIEAEAANPYRVREADSPKYTAPLRETPQTITVISAQLIQEQNLMSLRDVLSTVPGITFGAGEGGGGYGDSVNLRGYTASTDITLDGIRDSAQYSRSDSFNVQQVEVVNGANSVYAGSGSVGGTINLVSKRPQAESFTIVSGGLGTDEYARATIDGNRVFAGGIAARANLMLHKNDVPGRDYETFERRGLAPSVTLGLGSPTRLTLAYFHQHDDNVPQYGVPFYNGKPVPGVASSSYFGYHNIDKQKIDSDVVTAIVDHEFSDAVTLRNLTRYGKTAQLSIVDPPQGVYCLDNGMKPVAISASAPTGYSACAASDPAPGFYQPSGPRGSLRDTDNTLIANQLDLSWKFSTGFAAHTMVSGLALSHESFHLDTGRVLRNEGGATPDPVLPAMSIDDPDSTWTGPVHYVRSATQDGVLDNIAAYLFDTVKLNESLLLGGGVRYERNEGNYNADSYATPASGGAVTAGKTFYNSEDLLSYRAGLIYKPAANGSVYVAYGNARTPSKTSVNGSLTDATADVAPETAKNIELGSKWDLFNESLSLTAALFRNDRTHYKVASGDPIVTEQQLDGEARVQGASLGIAGRPTEHWAVYANYLYLDSEVLRGASRYLADRGYDYTKGDPLTNTPAHSASLWTTYDLPHRVQLGYGFTYQGEFYLTQHGGTSFDASKPDVRGVRSDVPLIRMPGYWVHRAMVTYGVLPQLHLRFNASNLLDRTYYTRARNNGWATPGDARAFVLSADYSF